MAKRSQNRLTAVLGTVAMLIALMLAPIAASAAGESATTKGVAVATGAVAAHAAHAMPCHKPASKPCPHCPQKSACPDAITCMTKCAQTLAVAPLGFEQPVPLAWLNIAAPAYAAEPRNLLIPPLLRPPIV